MKSGRLWRIVCLAILLGPVACRPGPPSPPLEGVESVPVRYDPRLGAPAPPSKGRPEQAETIPEPPRFVIPVLVGPFPRSLRLIAEPRDAPARLAETLRVDLARAGWAVEEVAADQLTDLYVGYEPPASFQRRPLTRTHFVPVTSFWMPVTEVTYLDLERIFAGQVGDWAEVGALRSEPIVPLVLDGDPPAPLQPVTATLLPDPAGLGTALEQHPGGIALVPREQVDLSMRALRVDGRDPLLEDEVLPGDPLSRTLFLAWSPALPPALVEEIAAWARGQELVPAGPFIEVVAVGDVVPGRTVERRILAYGGDYTRPFVRVAPGLRQADLTIANLEGALSDRITPPTDPTTFYFVGSGRFCEGLRYAGIDGVSLANNHSMNFGATGLSDTLSLLHRAEIAPFGAGIDLAAARRPALFEVDGITFAFLGYDAITHELYGATEGRPGTAPADGEMIAADIAAAREQADVVIPFFHWGWEYTRNPSPWQAQLAHQAVEAGADVVLGGHPHWIQGLERYQDVAIVHSLGNFVFDQMWSLETRQGLIVHLIFRGDRLIQIRLQAVQIEDYYQPYLLPAVQAEMIYQQVQSASLNWPNQTEGAEP